MRSRKSSGVLQLLKPPSTTLKRNNEFEGKKLKNKPKTRKLEKKKKKKEYKMKQWRMFLLQGLNSCQILTKIISVQETSLSHIVYNRTKYYIWCIRVDCILRVFISFSALQRGRKLKELFGCIKVKCLIRSVINVARSGCHRNHNTNIQHSFTKPKPSENHDNELTAAG